MSGKIRVMIVDDSRYMRFVITRMLAEESDIEIVGEAKDGEDALSKLEQFAPDVITLDIEMPKMDGLAALEKILEIRPTPVIMLSTLTEAGCPTTIRALEIGAVDYLQKPQGRDSLIMDRIKTELLEKIRTASKARLQPRHVPAKEAASIISTATLFDAPIAKKPAPAKEMKNLVVIGSSTGGPKALSVVLEGLKGDAPFGVLVVQHMPPGFTSSLARRLNQICPMEVVEAAEGDRIAPGKVFITPGDFHMKISKTGTLHMNQEPPIHAVRPAIDVTMASAAENYGSKVIAAILTGMGRDGTDGATLVKQKGGRTLAQSAETCVIDSMPMSLVNSGNADRVVPLNRMADEIFSMV